MSSDQRLTLFVALAVGLTLGVAIAGGIGVNRALKRRRVRKPHHDHEIHSWEGEGGNLPSVPPPVPSQVPISG